jgi:hypothetical protein
MMRWLLLVLVMLLNLSPLAEARSRRSSGGTTSVRPSVTRTGTLRQGHFRTSPNSTKLDNWSTKGNVNPFTGKRGSRNPW